MIDVFCLKQLSYDQHYLLFNFSPKMVIIANRGWSGSSGVPSWITFIPETENLTYFLYWAGYSNYEAYINFYLRNNIFYYYCDNASRITEYGGLSTSSVNDVSDYQFNDNETSYNYIAI